MKIQRALRVCGLGAVLVLASCGHDDTTMGPSPQHFTDPVAFVDGFSSSFNARNPGALAALLHSHFLFFPKSADLSDPSWPSGDSWGYDHEISILGNMLNPQFVSGDAASAGVTRVGALSLAVVSSSALPGGDYDAVVQGTMNLERGSLAPSIVPVALHLKLWSGSGGYLVLREMHEDEVTERATGPSWGLVQTWYRDLPAHYTDANALLAAHTTALTNRDFEAYAGLLDTSFEYFPQTVDLPDMPWMTGDSWPRVTELQMIRHMFDPAYEPSDPHSASIDAIHASLQVLTVAPDSAGTGQIVTTHAQLMVLYDASNGALCDVLFEFHLVPQSGHLMIQSIHELSLHAPFRGQAAVEPQTWGNLKALYR